jgi:hypothetical protein
LLVLANFFLLFVDLFLLALPDFLLVLANFFLLFVDLFLLALPDFLLALANFFLFLVFVLFVTAFFELLLPFCCSLLLWDDFSFLLCFVFPVSSVDFTFCCLVFFFVTPPSGTWLFCKGNKNESQNSERGPFCLLFLMDLYYKFVHTRRRC